MEHNHTLQMRDLVVDCLVELVLAPVYFLLFLKQLTYFIEVRKQLIYCLTAKKTPCTLQATVQERNYLAKLR